jgi:HPt (histidine-containing phosphotransfer) domain-containing protein
MSQLGGWKGSDVFSSIELSASEAEKLMAKNLIDLEELLERTENDRELMRDLLTIFKEEFPQRLQAVSEAVASLNATSVVLEAHALKGMLSNLAAIEAAEAVAELERLGRNNETSKLLESFSRFKVIAQELSQQIEACMAEVSG